MPTLMGEVALATRSMWWRPAEVVHERAEAERDRAESGDPGRTAQDGSAGQRGARAEQRRASRESAEEEVGGMSADHGDGRTTGLP